MPKLPVLSGKKLLALLKKNGFIEVRRKGSHVYVQHAQNNDRATIVPIHANEDLGKGLVKSILNDLRLSVDELIEMIGH